MIQERFWPQPTLLFFVTYGLDEQWHTRLTWQQPNSKRHIPALGGGGAFPAAAAGVVGGGGVGGGVGKLGKRAPAVGGGSSGVGGDDGVGVGGGVRGVGWRKCVLGCALVLAQIRLNFDAHDFSRQNLFSAFGRALLDGLLRIAAVVFIRTATITKKKNMSSTTCRNLLGSSKVAAGRAAFPDLPTKQSGGKARGAILLANGDEVVNALRCEGYRADVLIVDLNYIQFAWFVCMQFAWFVSHPAHLPVCVFARFVSHHAPAHLPGVAFPGSHYGNGPNSFRSKLLKTK
ncbi:hypothetical protein T492DRAFT_1141450 [Pavlovales sp. CCMP2436]|nr:hypothetical protein T492DRAFT_1141450 [Pavlovales sp. CCMP2436]